MTVRAKAAAASQFASPIDLRAREGALSCHCSSVSRDAGAVAIVRDTKTPIEPELFRAMMNLSLTGSRRELMEIVLAPLR